MHVFIIVLLILAILLVIFTLQNSFEISITAFFWEIPDAPLVLVLLICVLAGYLVAAIYFQPRFWMIKKERRRLSKENEKLKNELLMEKKSSPAEKSHPEGIELDVEEDEDQDKGFFKA